MKQGFLHGQQTVQPGHHKMLTLNRQCTDSVPKSHRPCPQEDQSQEAEPALLALKPASTPNKPLSAPSFPLKVTPELDFVLQQSGSSPS